MQNDDVTEEGHPRSKVGSVARPVPGWDVQLLTAANADYNEHHGFNHENVEKDAELVVKLPLPPGTMLMRMILSSSKWRDVRGEMGSFVWLKDVGLVDALPKTRSDKVMRATIKAVADSDPFCVPATIDNAAVLDDIHVELQKLGYVKTKSIVTGK
ncbi:hypothetical protein KXD40_007362 [Peronospora effusa]|nr:hypothetical protein KXD40_007362 [Peronospora effusa]